MDLLRNEFVCILFFVVESKTPASASTLRGRDHLDKFGLRLSLQVIWK